MVTKYRHGNQVMLFCTPRYIQFRYLTLLNEDNGTFLMLPKVSLPTSLILLDKHQQPLQKDDL